MIGHVDDVRTLMIPDPSLVVLVGAAGAGKSTFAARHFARDEVLSSDAYRAHVSGDERDQAATRPAFAALHRELARRLAARRLTVVDATNLERHARRSLLRRAFAVGVPAVAVVLDPTLDVALTRNRLRNRVVDESVVQRHHAALGKIGAPGVLEAEGFAVVHRLHGAAAAENVRLRRVPVA